MANNDPLKDLAGATKELKSLNKEMAFLESALKRVKGLVGTSLGGVKSVISSSMGIGTPLGLGVANAQFSNSAGGTTGTSMMPWAYSKKGSMGIAGVQLGLGVGAAAYAGLPDVATVMTRTSGFYNATRRMPGMSTQALTQASFGAIKGGITGPNEDMAAANVLTLGYGLTGGANFLQSMREVKGAALGYNMPNATAAMAIGGMHTGDMSANLYQYGISTLDVKTGKARTMDDIATQIYRKVYGTKKLTTAQQEFSLREGSLNRVVNDLGFNQAQQELLRPMLSQISQGLSPSLLNETGANNPAKDFYAQKTSEAKLADEVTANYLEGYKKATAAVVAFNSALEKTPGYVQQLKAMIDGVQGTSVQKSGDELMKTAKAVGGTLVGAAVFRKYLYPILKGLGKSSSILPETLATGGGTTGLLDMYGKPIAGTTPTATGKTAGSVAKGLAKKAGLGALTYSGLEALQGFLNKAPVPDSVRSLGNKAFDIGEGAATAFAATGNPYAAAAGGVAGAVGSMVKPVKPPIINGNDTEKQWATDLLKKVGAPVTAANLAGITTWMRYEGGGGGAATGIGKNSANYNPLNTTQGAPGSTSMNSVGVQSYLSRDQGLDATVKTLQNGKYGGVLDALKQGNDTAGILSAVGASPWGTFKNTPGITPGTGGAPAPMTGGPQTVNINLTISKASDAEAVAFAKKVKEILMKDKTLAAMGSK